MVAPFGGWAVPSAAQDAIPADTLYVNGRIVTNDPELEIVEAVAILDGKFIARGRSADMRKLAGPATRIVDLKGRTTLPGFYDNHIHLGSEGDPRDLDWEAIDSKEELLAAIKSRTAELTPGEWVIAHLKNENMPQTRLPTRWEIDAVSGDFPVSIRRGHVTIANSKAMALAKVDDNTPAPPGGAIDRDAQGRAIGWFREGSGRRMIMRAVPPAPSPPDAKSEEELRGQIAQLLPLGITSYNVAGMRPNTLRWMQETYEKWGSRLPRATVQLRLYPGWDQYDDAMEGARESIKELEALGFKSGFGNDRIKLGAIKVSVDGGFSAAAIMTIDSYPGRPDYHGVQRIPAEALYPVAKRASELGWQLGVHAMGDAAVKMVVDIYARVLDEKPRTDARHYLHHVSVLPPEDTMKKMAKYGILVASQPNFAYSLGPYNARPALTPEKLRTNNPQTSLIKHGIRVSSGSDNMPLGPLVGIYAAVTRRGIDGKIYGPEERVSVKDAIRMYTLESAYLTFDEKTRGSVEVGKDADLVVLGQDILTIDVEKIKDIPIDMTVVAGDALFTREAAK